MEGKEQEDVEDVGGDRLHPEVGQEDWDKEGKEDTGQLLEVT